MRRINDDRPAAVLDSPERVDFGREQVLGPPDRMIRGKRSKLKHPRGKALSSGV